MQVATLSDQTLDHLRLYRWDRIVERHDGPHSWADALRSQNPEFLEVDGFQVLLPIPQSHHPNIEVHRCVLSDDGRVLLLFLKDTTHLDEYQDPNLWSGFMAVCEKPLGEEFFLAIVYHEWFLIDNP